jgi:hypothetical protein
MRAGEYERVQRVVHEQLVVGPDLLVVIDRCEQQDPVSRFLRPAGERVQEGIVQFALPLAGLGDYHRDEVRPLGPQRLRRLEWPVSGRRDHRFDPLPGPGADQVRRVDHVRYGLQGHRGSLGDIGHRRTLCWHADPHRSWLERSI